MPSVIFSRSLTLLFTVTSGGPRPAPSVICLGAQEQLCVHQTLGGPGHRTPGRGAGRSQPRISSSEAPSLLGEGVRFSTEGG